MERVISPVELFNKVASVIDRQEKKKTNETLAEWLVGQLSSSNVQGSSPEILFVRCFFEFWYFPTKRDFSSLYL